MLILSPWGSLILGIQVKYSSDLHCTLPHHTHLVLSKPIKNSFGHVAAKNSHKRYIILALKDTPDNSNTKGSDMC